MKVDVEMPLQGGLRRSRLPGVLKQEFIINMFVGLLTFLGGHSPREELFMCSCSYDNVFLLCCL